MGLPSADWREKKLTEQFYAWELRGRGWRVFEEPVALEPPFRVFEGHFLPHQKLVDDGRKGTFVSNLLARFGKPDPKLRTEGSPELDVEPEPQWREAQNFLELQMSMPTGRSVPVLQVDSFLRQVCRNSEPLGLEIISAFHETVLQFVAPASGAATRLQRTAEACFPGIVLTPAAGTLGHLWRDSEECFAVADLGLGSEFMLPLGNPRYDLLAGIVTAMDGLAKGECALYQLLFEPVYSPWSESILAAVTGGDGRSFFENRPELVPAAGRKVASPLFGVVVRLAASAISIERAWEIIADLAAPLSGLSTQGSNFLVPLNNDTYAAHDHEKDILSRQTRRSGMVLNMEEVIPLLTPPTTSTSRKLRRETKQTNPVPEKLTHAGALCLGGNTHAGKTKEVFLSSENRVRHMHVIGASGTGKSTLLFDLIRQDIANGEGLAVFDPHGDLVDSILAIIPPNRIEDVVLLDPSDEAYSVGLNILAAHSDFERSLLASDLTSVFRRLSTSWGDQMESVLRNGILAFLESSRGGTLADLRHFLLDAAFRKDFLQTVGDPEVVYYWTKAFPQLTGGRSIGPLLTRLDEFLSRKPIRYMVSQQENRLDFAEILEHGRVLLVKIPQGLIGRENAALLGSLITAKIQMAAMSRQRMPAAQRRDFWCYMDEFQNFITPSMAEILGGARKYRLGLILAHQELRHLEADRDVSSAVLSNCGTRIVFRVGDADARALDSGFSHFEARDLMNLGIGEAVCRVERGDFDFNLKIRNLEPSDEDGATIVRERVIATSRTKYARPREEIEAELLKKWQSGDTARPQPARTSPRVGVPKISESIPICPIPNPSEEQSLEAESPVPVEAPPEPRLEPSQSTKEQSYPIESEGKQRTARPPDLGRGGVQHQAIQQRLKATAEEMEFRVTVEKSVLDGQGSVDLVLEKPESVSRLRSMSHHRSTTKLVTYQSA